MFAGACGRHRLGICHREGLGGDVGFSLNANASFRLLMRKSRVFRDSCLVGSSIRDWL